MIEFNFLEIDNWLAEDGSHDTLFIVFQDQYKLDLRAFDLHAFNGQWVTQSGISYKRESLAAQTDMGFNKEFLDQSHKVTVHVPQHIFQRGSLKVAFQADLSLEEQNESAGIDNFRMTAHGKSCRVTWTGGELPSEKIKKALKSNETKVELCIKQNGKYRLKKFKKSEMPAETYNKEKCAKKVEVCIKNGEGKYRPEKFKKSNIPAETYDMERCKKVNICIKKNDDFIFKKFWPDKVPNNTADASNCEATERNLEEEEEDTSKECRT